MTRPARRPGPSGRGGRWWQRLDDSHVMAAHRRYSLAGGDALSSAVTYSLLLALLPTLLLLAAGTSAVARLLEPALGDHRAAALAAAGSDAAHDVLAAVPLGGTSGQELFDAAGGPVTVFGTALAVYAALALFRAGRAAVRTLWGQPIGSGNPLVDLACDVRDGIGLAVVLLLGASVTALVGPGLHELGLPSSGVLTLQTMVLAAAAGAYLYWRLPLPDARVPGRARWSAAAAGSVGLAVATVVGTAYTALVADARGALYGALTGLVAALVIGNVAIRLALRALAWQLARFLPPLAEDGHPLAQHVPADLWVVVPAHNEARGLPDTLTALARQRDSDFTVVVVDNASTDATAEVAGAAAERLGLRLHVVGEDRKSPWAAMATGVAFARDHGATHVLRTDADALPRPGWVGAGRRAFAAGAQFVCGRVVPRRDEHPTLAERLVYPAAVRMAGLTGVWLNRSRAGVRYRTRYRLAQGPSLGFTVALWDRLPGPADGDLRTVVEDVALLNAARTHTVAVRRVEAMTVEASLRRLRAWGPRRLLLWHWDRRWTPPQEQTCDIR